MDAVCYKRVNEWCMLGVVGAGQCGYAREPLCDATPCVFLATPAGLSVHSVHALLECISKFGMTMAADDGGR